MLDLREAGKDRKDQTLELWLSERLRDIYDIENPDKKKKKPSNDDKERKKKSVNRARWHSTDHSMDEDIHHI
ncbi:MAG: hypothetical protein P8L31_02580 [Pseudomonadales bacterium]|nr:hypothetical protein [Pseudomonadales bacterium]